MYCTDRQRLQTVYRTRMPQGLPAAKAGVTPDPAADDLSPNSWGEGQDRAAVQHGWKLCPQPNPSRLRPGATSAAFARLCCCYDPPTACLQACTRGSTALGHQCRITAWMGMLSLQLQSGDPVMCVGRPMMRKHACMAAWRQHAGCVWWWEGLLHSREYPAATGTLQAALASI